MRSLHCLAVLACLLTVLGCSGHSGEEPIAELQPTNNASSTPPPKPEQLRDRIDRILEFTEHQRQMTLEKHAAWQLLHGTLAFGEKFEMLADGKPEVVVDWVFDGKPMKGWSVVPTDRGLMVTIEPGKYGQGHEEQWLAILPQWNVPITRKVIVGGKEYTVYDMVKRSMYDCYEGKESSWTVIALSKHLNPIDQKWMARDGEEWTLERLMSMEGGPIFDEAAGQEMILMGACGGTHRLIGLSIALNNYRARKPDAELTGGWLAADKRIKWATEQARLNQLPTGAFSVAFLMRPANSANIDEHLAATGHMLEFLAFALPKEQLEQAWIERAVAYLCGLLERTKHLDLECGSLYHAAHGLVLYREKVFGPREGKVRPDLMGAGITSP